MKSAQGYTRILAFKDFSSLSSGDHLVNWSGTILDILVGSHLGHILVEFESHWPKKIAFKANYSCFFLFLALAAILFIGTELFWLFW